MKRQINPNLRFLVKTERDGQKGAVLEGSSRSGKTWSSIDFIIKLCAQSDEPLVFNIVKETYHLFKTTLYDDFNKRLPMFGIPSPFADRKEVGSFKIFGSKINLIGADKASKFEGAQCDYLWFNEVLEIPQKVYDEAKRRCSKFFWMDYNPKYTSHWVFDAVIPRDDVSFLKTTFIDNPFIPPGQKREILASEPTEENIRQGTANEYQWNVFGLGIRAAVEGVVFKEETDWRVTEEWPDKFKWEVYGMDFGFQIDPTTCVQVGYVNGEYYVKQHLWETGLTNPDIYRKLRKMNIQGDIVPDSAEHKSIEELNRLARTNPNNKMKFWVYNKAPGSVVFGLNMMLEKRINVWHESKDLIGEFRFFKWLVKANGEQTGKPENKHKHGIDAVRYAILWYLDEAPTGIYSFN